MALDIVYGYQGKDHVKASQLARLLSGTIGEGRYVLGTQNEMAASMQTANKVRIATGDLVMDGRYITNEAYQDLTVDSGQSGYKRNDLVGVQYSRASGSDADHAVETVSLVVKKGTQTTGTATDPSYTAGDIAAGDASAFYPLWRLPINGLTVGTPVQLFDKAPSVADLRETISQTVSVLQSQTSNAVTVTAYERAGIVCVSVSRMVNPGSGAFSSSKTVIGRIAEGYEPSGTLMQLMGTKASGEWLHMGVDASGDIFISALY